MSTLVEDWVAQGEVKGEVKSIILILTTRCDAVPASLEARIKEIKDVDRLDELTRVASKCVSLEEFERALGE